LFQPQRDGLSWRSAFTDVNHARMKRSAGDFEHQLAAWATGPVGHLGIKRPLESETRRAPKSKRARRTTHRNRVELSGFDQDMSCGGPDLRLNTTHDAAEPDRALRVCDHQHL